MTATRRGVLSLALAGMEIGCSSSEPAYFILAPVPGTAMRGGPTSVELRRPGLAGYLDRPEIVRANSAYSLRVVSGERWGEPLGDLVARILAENLNQRLPGSNVFTSTGSITAEANAKIELDIQRLDADPSGKVVLLAQVAVSRGRAKASVETRTMRLDAQPASTSTSDLVAAMSDVLGQLADLIAPMLRGK